MRRLAWSPWQRWLLLPAWFGSLLPLLRNAVAAEEQSTGQSTGQSTKGGSKKCRGRYKSPVVNLCESHWPDDKAEKVWFLLFYAPWCGHCQTLEPKYVTIAKELKEEKGIGIGAVDCNEIANQELCKKYGVRGYPVMKAMVGGKPKPYHGMREIIQMKEWILKVRQNRGTKGGSQKCPVGIFNSKVFDAVVPLCEHHFPADNAKNAWLIIFYNEKDEKSVAMKERANQAASDLGSDPPSTLKEHRKQKKRRDRVKELGDKYEMDITLPEKGPFGMDALAKVGGLCCDCEKDSEEFCSEMLGEEHRNSKRPLVAWVEKGKVEGIPGKITAQFLVNLTLTKFGFLGGEPEQPEEKKPPPPAADDSSKKGQASTDDVQAEDDTDEEEEEHTEL